jgi:hypothetical protein
VSGNGDITPILRKMLELPEPTTVFEIERVTVQEGKTFSAIEMQDLERLIMLWVTTRCTRRWELTREPPTALRVTVTVDVS